MSKLPDDYWNLRTEEVVVNGVWYPVTACFKCGKRLPPYKATVPAEQKDDYCWGTCS